MERMLYDRMYYLKIHTSMLPQQKPMTLISWHTLKGIDQFVKGLACNWKLLHASETRRSV